MTNTVTNEGRPRLRTPLILGIVAVLMSGCAVVAHSGPDFHTMSAPEHIRAACDLQDRAKQVQKRFDPSAQVLLRPAHSSWAGHGMNTTSSTSRAEYYNPTYRYVVKARDLRLKARRHIAAAGSSAVADRETCAASRYSPRSYGSGLNWW